jgi:antitoxin ParD1/3/4
MADRQTRNVSLPPHQDAFVDALVSAGRYRTASEVVREGLRLLEQSEHRRLLEKWIYDGLTEQEEEQLPADLKASARAHFRGLVDAAMQDVEHGRVADGPAAMRRLRMQLEARSD